MAPHIEFTPRCASPSVLAWVTDAVEYLGTRIQTLEEWIRLGGQMRSIDESLAPLWWSVRPPAVVEHTDQQHLVATSRSETLDPCKHHWERLLPSASGGCMYGLWKWAVDKGWKGGGKNPLRQSWDHLEELVVTRNWERFEKERWTKDTAFRVLQEMSMWFLSQHRRIDAETAEGWSHQLLSAPEERRKATGTALPVMDVVRSRTIKKANAKKEAVAGPSS